MIRQLGSVKRVDIFVTSVSFLNLKRSEPVLESVILPVKERDPSGPAGSEIRIYMPVDADPAVIRAGKFTRDGHVFELGPSFRFLRSVVERNEKRLGRKKKLLSVGIACVGVRIFAPTGASVARNHGVVVESRKRNAAPRLLRLGARDVAHDLPAGYSSGRGLEPTRVRKLGGVHSDWRSAFIVGIEYAVNLPSLGGVESRPIDVGWGFEDLQLENRPGFALVHLGGQQASVSAAEGKLPDFVVLRFFGREVGDDRPLLAVHDLREIHVLVVFSGGAENAHGGIFFVCVCASHGADELSPHPFPC